MLTRQTVLVCNICRKARQNYITVVMTINLSNSSRMAASVLLAKHLRRVLLNMLKIMRSV